MRLAASGSSSTAPLSKPRFALLNQQGSLPFSRQLSTATVSKSRLLTPEERLEELTRLGITPYPRYSPPKVPLVEIGNIIKDYQDVLEDGSKDETKKVSISGMRSL